MVQWRGTFWLLHPQSKICNRIQSLWTAVSSLMHLQNCQQDATVMRQHAHAATWPEHLVWDFSLMFHYILMTVKNSHKSNFCFNFRNAVLNCHRTVNKIHHYYILLTERRRALAGGEAISCTFCSFSHKYLPACSVWAVAHTQRAGRYLWAVAHTQHAGRYLWAVAHTQHAGRYLCENEQKVQLKASPPAGALLRSINKT